MLCGLLRVCRELLLKGVCYDERKLMMFSDMRYGLFLSLFILYFGVACLSIFVYN